MAKQFFVFKKYSKRTGRRRCAYRRVQVKLLGGTAKFYERNNEYWEDLTVMQKILNRVHNDEEYYLSRQTSPKAYKRYFLNAPIQVGQRK